MLLLLDFKLKQLELSGFVFRILILVFGIYLPACLWQAGLCLLIVICLFSRDSG